jgi:hypothetical protein
MRKTASDELNELGKRVETWRRQRRKRARIPDELWAAAVGVAKLNGVWATARVTRFNYEKLNRLASEEGRQERGGHKLATALTVVDSVPAEGRAPATMAPAFVQLPAGAASGLGAAAVARTVIDLVGRHGDRMRVELSGGVDLAALVQGFWEQRP